ncbi:MAG: virulence RhuM family protein [Chloroflexota bacterium]|nr:virulence RhuM family protein [Chloroflexota bacterium]MDE2948933.1 virulence RhuM family protein [Chloroflexota bacterium]
MATDNHILLYETADGETRLEVQYRDESVWLSQRDMSILFQKAIPTIIEHIRNVYAERELEQESTTRKFRVVQIEGGRRVSREVSHYNLDMIISVGYRVNSYRGTQFRIWATRQLREFIVKGFVMDDDRLAHGGSNYFEELEQRIRNIRSSEYNFYRKVLDVFATSIDYQSSNAVAKKFFGTVQNKFHYAIHGHTAAELILERVGRDKLNMGLTTWKRDTMTVQDAFVAKNYLEAIELTRLNLLVEQFLSFAELQVVDQRPMYMADWVKKLDQFIGELNEMPLLQNAGKVSRDAMKARVRKEYEAYRERLMLEEKLSEEEFARRLQDAGDKMLPPGDT